LTHRSIISLHKSSNLPKKYVFRRSPGMLQFWRLPNTSCLTLEILSKAKRKIGWLSPYTVPELRVTTARTWRVKSTFDGALNAHPATNRWVGHCILSEKQVEQAVWNSQSSLLLSSRSSTSILSANLLP